MLKEDPHTFLGLQQDVSYSVHEASKLVDALNIRYVSRDSNTQLTITNEKGTSDSLHTYSGVYLGHCVVDNYLTLFTKGDSDHIYIINLSNSYIPYAHIEGTYNFDVDHPFETLGVYENEDILKVYWVDGINSPRMLKIFTDEDRMKSYIESLNRSTSAFDFIPELALKETVSIERVEGGGRFNPGVIQYAFTYFNKYGSESNIFYTSLLHYISYPERGAAGDTTVGNEFVITINNVQNSKNSNSPYVGFDYLRVYSIHKTSLEGTPMVKRVIDVPLSEENNSVTVVDNGMIGESLDPTELLYIGGESIVASTLAQKDNTLFLGDYEINRPALIKSDFKGREREEESDLEHTLADDSPIITEGLNKIALKDTDSTSGYYFYVNQLSKLTPGFKNREHYRLGLQFQYKTGKWSEPIFLKDYTLAGDNNPSIDVANGIFTLKSPKLTYTLKERDVQIALEKGYKKVRGVVVFPSVTDRLILTQGLLCPTVFNVKDRYNDAPFAQSSWFFRPYLNANLNGEPISDNADNTISGGVAEFRHFYSLSPDTSRNCEVQGSSSVGFIQNHNPSINQSHLNEIDSREFYVDQSILTMHSPDIEFDDRLQFLNYSEWKLKLVGYANFTSNVGDIDIQTESPANNGFSGFLKTTAGLSNKSTDYWKGAKRLIAGNLWEDGIIEIHENDNVAKVLKRNNENVKKYYTVYPWHKGGSLNNDDTRANGTTATAKLSKKKLSNVLFSGYNTFFNKDNKDESILDQQTYDITNIQFFTSDQVTMLRIPFKEDGYINSSVSYYGNVDTMFSGDVEIKASSTKEGYPEVISEAADGGYTLSTKLGSNIRMKYKSTKHLVFSLLYNGQETPSIKKEDLMQTLPTFNDGTASLNPVTGGALPGVLQPPYFNTNVFYWNKDAYKDAAIPSDNTWVKFKVDSPVDIVHYSDYSGRVRDHGADVEQMNRHLGGTPRQNGDYILIQDTTTILYICQVEAVTDQHQQVTGYYYPIITTAEHSKWHYAKSIVENGNTVEDKSTLEWYEGIDTGMTDEWLKYGVKEDPQAVPENRSFGIVQNAIYLPYPEHSFLFLGELTRTPRVTDFGGDPSNPEVLKSNLWLPAGEAQELVAEEDLSVDFIQGDTFYQRYDCLKTYPFTMEDTNSIVEIGSFLCETRYNIDGRWDRNRGNTSNLTATPENFNRMNDVYNQSDNFFTYRILDRDFYNINRYGTSLTWTKAHWPVADTDLWTNITLASTYDLDGIYGKITALRTFRDKLYAFQKNAIVYLPFNTRVEVSASDGIPIEIANSQKLENKQELHTDIGCSNKFSIVNSETGIYFIDHNTGHLHQIGGDGGATDVSFAQNMTLWFNGRIGRSNTEEKTFYDSNNKDIYLTYSDTCLDFSQQHNVFTSFLDYGSVSAMVNHNSDLFALKNEEGNVNLYKMFSGDYCKFFGVQKGYYFSFVSNPDITMEKIFTNLSVQAQFFNPEHSIIEEHEAFFDYIEVGDPTKNYQYTGKVDISFSRRNPYPSRLKKKFRNWHIDIPRSKLFDDTNRAWTNTTTMQRIRDNYALIKLGTKVPNFLQGYKQPRMEFHNLSVQYYV